MDTCVSDCPYDIGVYATCPVSSHLNGHLSARTNWLFQSDNYEVVKENTIKQLTKLSFCHIVILSCTEFELNVKKKHLKLPKQNHRI